MKRLMILGASILQLPAIKKAKEMGLEVISVDMDENAVGFKYADVKLVISTLDTIAVMKAAKEYNIDGIITIASDMPMRTVAEVSTELGIPGVSSDTALKATNKAYMRKALFEANVPVPMFFKASNFSEFKKAVNYIRDNGLRCIVKPVDSSGSRGVDLVEGFRDDELSYAFEYCKQFSRSGDVIVEEFMEGPEVSVETISIDGKCYIIQVTDKLTTGQPYFVEMGHSQPSMLNPEIINEIKKVTIDANKAVGIINGPSHTEIKITQNGPKIVEIGARLGGDNIATHLTPLSTGIDMVESCIRIALGEKTTLERKFEKAAAIRYLSTNIGIIKNITGVEEAQKLAGINQVSIVRGVDYESKEIKSSVDRIGFVIAYADKPDIAINICENAKKHIEILVQ